MNRINLITLGVKDIDEQHPPARTGFSGLTLAYNAKSIKEVDDVMNKAAKAGAEIIKPSQRVF